MTRREGLSRHRGWHGSSMEVVNDVVCLETDTAFSKEAFRVWVGLERPPGT